MRQDYHLDLIALERLFRGQDREALTGGLPYKNAVEGIAPGGYAPAATAACLNVTGKDRQQCVGPPRTDRPGRRASRAPA